jgi:hypothetical protein
MNRRFEQGDVTIEDFGHLFLVECPECGRRATVINRGRETQPQIMLSCADCGHAEGWKPSQPGIMYAVSARHYEPGRVCIGAAVDWYFHLPLWLRIGCCGETLWAYNAEHLKYLEEYVGAGLRARARDEQYGWSNKSLASRLPAWIKSAKNRSEILKCIAKLKRRLE